MTIGLVGKKIGMTREFLDVGISVPVTLIAAQLDKGVPPSDMERVATEIPNANFTLINDAGHIANLDQPEAFNRALIRHFQDSTEN